MRILLGTLIVLLACSGSKSSQNNTPKEVTSDKVEKPSTTAAVKGSKPPKIDLENPCKDLPGPSKENQETTKTGKNDPTLAGYAKELIPLVENIRGVKSNDDVKMVWVSKQEVCKYLLGEIDKQSSPEERIGQEHALKVLNLIPEETELEKLFIALMTEQAAGFYDPRQKTLFVADWMTGVMEQMQKPVLAHEMYHAIQDQTLDLTKALFEIKNDDTKLAHSALFEGDGTLLMTLVSAAGPDGIPKENLPQILTRLDSMQELMRTQAVAASAAMPFFASAPKAIQANLLFPYLEGLSFVLYGAKTKSLTGIDNAYKELPASTEQILHPEKYFDQKDIPSSVELPKTLSVPEGFSNVYEDVLGEFVLRLMLGNGEPKSKEADVASGWDGDRFRTFVKEENGKVSRGVVAVLVWDDEAGATKIKNALLQTFPDATIESNKPNIFSFALGFGEKTGQIAKDALTAKVLVQ